MASSRKSSRSKAADTRNLAARVAAQLKDIVKPSGRLVAGLSGGVDSVVLLDCLQRASRKLRFRLAALHVNHELSRHARSWEAFCRDLCRARGIPFRGVKVRVPRGNSVEGAARAARYSEFGREQADYVVLAQHRDDQAETVLLQLLRGAGVKGLAAMPPVRKSKVESRKSKGDPAVVTRHPSASILRPLLDTTREEILAYARKRRLKWIEDESNADIYFQRNFLRHKVLPVIERRFPSYRTTLARSARHLAEAARLLDEVAAADAAGYMEEKTLAVEALRRLPAARARNLLRHFLSSHGLDMPGAERLEEALRQALGARADSRLRIELEGASLFRFGSKLHVVPDAKRVDPGYVRTWRGERELALPELGGVLKMVGGRGKGISRARLRAGAVTIRVRRGGERLQPDCRRPRRSLKKLLQEARMPPWQRERIPLLFCGEELVWSDRIGIDCAFQATPSEAAVRPAWAPGV
jgi:tRNA(Ile)-lysidine synthase